MTKLVENSKGYNTKSLWNALNIRNKTKTYIDNAADISSSNLNEHFTSIAAKLSKDFSLISDFSSTLPNYHHKGLKQFPKLTTVSLHKLLKSIPIGKSTGPDQISVRMLNKTFPYIGPVLTDIFNRILDEGVFPKVWKIARVTPIFKSGSKDDPGNYRPISVLPVLSKIFEKHLNINIQIFLNENHLISSSQSGFRTAHSCSDAVHKIISDYSSEKLKQRKSIFLFIDFCKAFDCVDHQILKNKLQNFNFENKAFLLLSSFLQDRSQYVHFDGAVSSILDINIGVPQGSILAPTLFQIYINDLLNLPLSSNSYAYADDTVFVASHSVPSTLVQICNRDLVSINKWCKNNHMTINYKKSHFLSSFGEDSSLNLKIDNNQIFQRHETELLGFKISDSFSLNGHCETVLDKVSKNTNLLKLCRPYLTTHSAKQFYFQFIHCYLIYGIHIYYNLCASNITNPIFTQQKRALRIVANVQHIPFYLSPTNDLCTSLKILPLPILSNYFTCITGFKALNNLSPPYISDFFVTTPHRFPRRDTHLLKPPLDNLNHKIATNFNILPSTLRSTLTLNMFKKRLMQHFFSLLA